MRNLSTPIKINRIRGSRPKETTEAAAKTEAVEEEATTITTTIEVEIEATISKTIIAEAITIIIETTTNKEVKTKETKTKAITKTK